MFRVYTNLSPVTFLEGVVERGFGRGSKSLGFPTANLNSNSSASVKEFLNSPSCQDGIYVGWASIEGFEGIFNAAISVGLNPTFEDSKVRLLEAHLIDFSGPNFYGRRLRLILCAFIRPTLKFESIESLKEEIWNDCEFSREWLEKDQSSKALEGSSFLTWNS